ncbi:MAG: hypothetical protein IM589_15045 [Cytophagales bacterium]|nr:hypothetical protein [Cytophagales bacterium]
MIVPLDMTKRPYIPQQDVSYMAGYSVAIKNSFLNLVPPRGTDWRFKSPPHPIHTRYAQCRADNDGASNIGTFACRTNPRDTKASKRAKRFPKPTKSIFSINFR